MDSILKAVKERFKKVREDQVHASLLIGEPLLATYRSDIWSRIPKQCADKGPLADYRRCSICKRVLPFFMFFPVRGKSTTKSACYRRSECKVCWNGKGSKSRRDARLTARLQDCRSRSARTPSNSTLNGIPSPDHLNLPPPTRHDPLIPVSHSGDQTIQTNPVSDSGLPGLAVSNPHRVILQRVADGLPLDSDSWFTATSLMLLLMDQHKNSVLRLFDSHTQKTMIDSIRLYQHLGHDRRDALALRCKKSGAKPCYKLLPSGVRKFRGYWIEIGGGEKVLLEFLRNGIGVQFTTSKILGQTNDQATNLAPEAVLVAMAHVLQILPPEIRGARVTRLDLAVDFTGFDTEMENQAFLRRLRRLRIPRSKASHYPHKVYSTTTYIGAKRGAWMFSAYDKSAEMKKKEIPAHLIPPNRLRCELKLHPKGTCQLVDILEPGTDVRVCGADGRVHGLRLDYQRLHAFQFSKLVSLRLINDGLPVAARAHRELLERTYPGIIQRMAQLMMSVGSQPQAA